MLKIILRFKLNVVGLKFIEWVLKNMKWGSCFNYYGYNRLSMGRFLLPPTLYPHFQFILSYNSNISLFEKCL